LAEATLGLLRPQTVSYAEALETFLSTLRLRPRTQSEYRRVLTKHFPFRGRQLQSLTSGDIVRVVDGLGSTPYEARHVHEAARRFFGWCVERSYLENSPLAKLRAPPLPQSRDRVLTTDELARVAATARITPHPFGPIVSLCLLTAQRRSEIGMLRWSWIDAQNRTVQLPAAVSKNRRLHLYPYGDAVAEILAQIPRTGDLLFPSRDDDSKTFYGLGEVQGAVRQGLRGDGLGAA
jgi:integrase